jgi:hypothetical protein
VVITLSIFAKASNFTFYMITNHPIPLFDQIDIVKYNLDWSTYV